MKALVTGGAGFVGSALVDRLLADGCDVDVIDDLSSGSEGNLAGVRGAGDRFRFHHHDVRQGETAAVVAGLRPEVVFHLAAQADVRVSVEDPVGDADVNVLGTLRVCEGALAGGARKIVLAGSGGTLYGAPRDLPVGEGAPQVPISPYGVAKKAAGDYLRYYREVRGLETTILALANVYGPRQDPHGEAGVVAIFTGKLLARERPVIYGGGTQTRDFVYVGDVADAFARAAHSGDGALCNIGTGVETSVNTLFEVIARLTGYEGEAVRAPARVGELDRSALDPSLAGKVLGWEPTTTLEDGLRSTRDWFHARV